MIQLMSVLIAVSKHIASADTQRVESSSRLARVLYYNVPTHEDRERSEPPTMLEKQKKKTNKRLHVDIL